MANWASPAERFVEVPGVVDIRRKSDDPDFYEKPVDLFDHQAKNEGLPDSIGKKDPFTTLQTYFTCNVCECELKSVVTLRAHCRGTQHIRKSLQKKKEYKDKQKLLESTKDTTEKRERSSYGRDGIKGSSLGKDEKSWGREKNRTSDGEEKKEDYKRERHHSREGAARTNFRSRSRENERRYGNWNDRKIDQENVKVEGREVDRNIKYENDKERKRHDIKEEKDCQVRENRRDRDSNFGRETSSSNQPRNSEANQLENQEKSANQEITVLHRKVADYVKKCLNEYWANLETTEPKNRKINDANEYAKLAKSFSHKMRDQIKETYEQYHRTLEGIAITADNKLHIKATIEMEMDSLPVIKLEG